MQSGQPQSLKDIYESFSSVVFNTVISYLQNREDAEEITQDVFVEIHNSLHKFHGNSSLSTWIYRIAVNKSLDFLRKKKRKKRFAFLTSLFDPESGRLLHDSPDFFHPGIALEKKEQAATLFAAISELPETQQTAFILSRAEGLSNIEIAEIMKISVGAVESLQSRAKANLKKILLNKL